MKTAEQVARGVFDTKWNAMTVRQLMVAAVEADRAQRGESVKTVADRVGEAAFNVNAVLLADGGGLISLSDYERGLLVQARERMTAIAAELRNEDVEHGT